MATLKRRLYRKNSSGTYDIVYLETSADLITGSVAITNGGTGATTAANARSNLGITPANIGAAASSHNHTTSNITSGSFSVSRGGTGRSTLTSGYFLRGNGTSAVTMSSIDQVKTALGISSSSCSIIFGSYVGTGTYGDENFNTLKFNEPIKLLYIYGNQDTTYFQNTAHGFLFPILITGTYDGALGFSNGNPSGYSANITFYPLLGFFDGSTIKWYNPNDASRQLNNTGRIYNYIALI